MPTVEEMRERLRRPLQRELDMGCTDRVVSGGLEKLMENVGGPFPKLRELLRGYAGWDSAKRFEQLSQALLLLNPVTDTPTSTTTNTAPTKTTAKANSNTPPPITNLLTPETDLARLALGPGGAKKLASLGMRNVRDVLHNYPRRYEDRRALPGFHALVEDERVTVIGTVLDKSRYAPRPGMNILRVTLRDDWGNSIVATWFNQPWIEKSLKVGSKLIVTGKAKQMGRKFTVGVEYFEPLDEDGDSLSTGRIIGVYGATEGVSQAFLRKSVKLVLAGMPEIEDYVPHSLRNKHSLMRLDQAIREIHWPSDETTLENAMARLRFDEYLFLELRVLLQEGHALFGKKFSALDTDVDIFEATLPFRYTNAQRRAIGEIATDMRRDRQMARLIQGDVGSGKTAVAATALYLATRDGYQGALMAPTEILARQHFSALSKYLFPLGVRVELLIGAMTSKEHRETKLRLENGQTQVVVGTSALIQEGVRFANLGLAVVDEEHRFGVTQRRALLQDRPDVLVMSATPIPRSLALTAYGDLELTVIDELPPGRTPIQTKLLTDTQRRQAYTFVMGQLREGRQAYVVAPLVEESEKLTEILAATQLADDLRIILPEARIDLLHGKMAASEKDQIMDRFRRQEFDLLVSTTVIEVGVDVANATVMVIENAERFGLSQLHQLRGRVGRGTHKSYCILVAGDHSKKTKERLKVIEGTTDGFKIAEADLRLRGPGELRGTKQSGLLELKLGDLARDVEVIEQARSAAKDILEIDPRLEQPQYGLLKVELQARSEQVAVRDVI
jgi:ATP-dependent DNA helicase RecG